MTRDPGEAGATRQSIWRLGRVDGAVRRRWRRLRPSSGRMGSFRKCGATGSRAGPLRGLHGGWRRSGDGGRATGISMVFADWRVGEAVRGTEQEACRGSGKVWTRVPRDGLIGRWTPCIGADQRPPFAAGFWGANFGSHSVGGRWVRGTDRARIAGCPGAFSARPG